MLYQVPIDLNQLELQRPRVHVLPSAPSTPVTGQLYYNSGSNKLFFWNGTIWVDTTGGLPSAPSGPAGGVLTGTYPNPTISPGALVNADINAAAAIAYAKLALGNSVTNADIAAAAAIAYSKLNLANSIVNADIAAGAAIAYSKLNLGGNITNSDIAVGAAIALSKLAVDPLARANHTGTQLAATISNFDTQVRTSRLDQMATPTAAVPMGSQRITNMADGTGATDAVTKQQLDAASAGLDPKASVRAASTANVTLASPGTTIDTVTMAAGDRVLLKNQTTGSENGIWIWNGSAVPMTRATDADTSAEVNAGMFTFVEEGGTQDNTGWVLSTNNPIVLGTTSLAYTQFSSSAGVTAGNGLVQNANAFDVNPDNTSIEVVADIVRVKALGITNAMLTGAIDLTTKVTGALPIANGGTGQITAKASRETGLAAAGYYSSATHGAGTTISIPQATHLLRATRGLIVQIRNETTGAEEIVDSTVNAGGDVTVTFAASVAANSYRVTIIG